MKAYPRLDSDGDVLLLDLGDQENRFAPASVAAIRELLDEVAAAPTPKALVTRAHGKHFSSGLDLEWIVERPEERREPSLRALHDLLALMLVLPFPTVAAAQGHAFGAGAMFVLVHDIQVMRDGRGFWCLPEVSLGLPFTVGMTALLRAKLPKRTAHTAMTTAKRYRGAEAVAAGIVDVTAASEDAVLSTAVDLARELAPNAGTALGITRSRMYTGVVEALRTDTFGPGGAGSPAR